MMNNDRLVIPKTTNVHVSPELAIKYVREGLVRDGVNPTSIVIVATRSGIFGGFDATIAIHPALPPAPSPSQSDIIKSLGILAEG